MTRVAVLGSGSLGHGVRDGAGRRRAPTSRSGAARRRVSTRSTAGTRTADYLPRHPAARRDRGDHRPGRGAGRRRRRRARRAVADACAPTSTTGRRAVPRGRRCWSSLMKGVELGTTKRMSEVVAEVARVAAGAHRRRAPGRTWPGRSPSRQPAASVVACVDERRRRAGRATPARRRTSGPTPTPTSSASSSAARSRTSSRWRSGWPRAWAWATTRKASIITRGLAETDPARRGARRRPGDVRRPGRRRRPRRHVHVAAVAQPHLRRAPRPGHDRRGGRRPSTKQTAEGVKSLPSRSSSSPAPHGVDMPIIEQVVAVVHGRRRRREMASRLLGAPAQARGRLTCTASPVRRSRKPGPSGRPVRCGKGPGCP